MTAWHIISTAVAIVVLGELTMWCRARFEVFQLRFAKTWHANVVLHGRLAALLLSGFGFLLVSAARCVVTVYHRHDGPRHVYRATSAAAAMKTAHKFFAAGVATLALVAAGLAGVPAAVLGFLHPGGMPFAVVAAATVLVAGGLAAHRRRTGTVAGFAQARDIHRHVSATAVRQSSATARPGITAADYHPGTLLGTVNGRKLWAAHKDVILVIAPPQTGKSGYLGGRVIDAPGAVVVTSTKADLLEHTAALRATRGPVMVFDPENISGTGSTFRWSPIPGCIDPEIAAERAGYLLAGAEPGNGENAKFFAAMNAKLLRGLLMAADVAGRDMRDVWAWVGDPDDDGPQRILENSPGVPRGWASELRQIATAPDRTRQSIYLTLSEVLGFMTAPAIAEAVCPEPGEQTFTVPRFLTDRGSLYLIGSDRPYGAVSPLFTGIIGLVFEEAKRAAARCPGGRLDPPLTLVLDEVANIASVPLPQMTADSGGRGIQLIPAVQSPSQLYERWGQRGGETIINNANAKLIFGGLSHARDLDDLSKLCGEREEEHRGMTIGEGNRSSHGSIRRVPVLSADAIRTLPAGEALLIYRSMPPVVVAMERVWERDDVKAAAKAAAAAAAVSKRAVGWPGGRPAVAPAPQSANATEEIA